MHSDPLPVITITPVSPTNEAVQKLVATLDTYQISLYNITPCQLEPVALLERSGAYMVGAYEGDRLIGIGAVKLFDDYSEIKRMYVEEGARGKGCADKILGALEEHARKNRRFRIYLETGNLQEAAIRFYKRSGYSEVDSFGGRVKNGVSVYFYKECTNLKF